MVFQPIWRQQLLLHHTFSRPHKATLLFRLIHLMNSSASFTSGGRFPQKNMRGNIWKNAVVFYITWILISKEYLINIHKPSYKNMQNYHPSMNSLQIIHQDPLKKHLKTSQNFPMNRSHGFYSTKSLPGGPHQEADAGAPFHSKLGSVLSQSVDWPLSLEPQLQQSEDVSTTVKT